MIDYAAYVMYVNRPDLIQRAVDSFPTLIDRLTLIDNSPDGAHMQITGTTTFRPPVPFTYAQSMNYILKDALERKVDFIIHFHSDAYSINPNAVEELLFFARKVRDEGRRWACLWSHYDLLWIINPAALEDIGGWDTNLPTYFGDQDARRRWALAGWECIDTHIQGINHEGSATINSDPKLQFINSQVFPLHRQYYIQKHGGEPGHERYTVPFDNQEIFGKGE